MSFMRNEEQSREKYLQWWEGRIKGRPLMHIVGRRGRPSAPPAVPKEAAQKYLDVEYIVESFRSYLSHHQYMGDSFPSVDLDLGPGSLALYLGSEPIFNWDTVWYEEVIEDLETHGGLRFDAANKWWVRHSEMIRRAVELSRGEFYVSIPDLIENIDILAAMRGAQNTIYDMVDEPELVKRYIGDIDDCYFSYYDRLYDAVKAPDGSSTYTVFSIWSPGRTAKVQCDFSAMISPELYREFIQESIRKQCGRLDYSLYHLDGKDAIKHLDAIMEVKELNALQWTCGAGQPDGGYEGWDIIYDKAVEAGKSLWIKLEDGSPKDWVAGADRLVKKYGASRLFLLFPDCDYNDAAAIMDHAENSWR